jgi:hypothetical protein
MVLPDDTIVHKIGMCNSNRSTDRMMEILRSWFTKFRFVPYSELKLDMETGRPRELEEHIHKALYHKRYVPEHKVSGGTEMFVDINEFRVLHYLRMFNDKLLDEPLDLSDEDYKNLGEYLSP